jgi:hypothetical protein
MDVWCGPWLAILNSLFPLDEGYLVNPLRRLPDDPDSDNPDPDADFDSHIPDFIIKVVLSAEPFILRTVLVVKIKNSQHWESGIQWNSSSINKLMLPLLTLDWDNWTPLEVRQEGGQQTRCAAPYWLASHHDAWSWVV